MKQILLNIPLLFILIFLSGNFTYAQDVYLSISGQNTRFLSGDDRHEYDIWIKPEAGADSSILQVYDAGLGGAVDLITRRSNTETLYQIFSFDEKYELSPSGVQPVENVSEPSSTLLVQNEERFKNRWVPLTELSPGSNNGYLLRVSTSEGADVNNFNLRIVNQNGEVVSGQDWNIITFDLSFGFYRSSPSDYFQLRPYQIEGNQNTDLVVSGEEDSQIQKIDAFGEIYSLQNSQIPATKFNLANSWGLNMSGSNEVINNFTIFGTDGPVLWVYDPILITQPTSPFGSIVESVTNSCTELAFELRSNAYQSEALQNTRWLLNEAELAVGQQPLINFQEKGALTINALVPNLSSYFPEYWVYDKEIFVNTPPVAQLTVPKEIISPSEQITISAADSYDPEGQDLEYTWFVNGTRRGTGPTFSFSNTISGSYRISVRVSDGGNTQQCSITEAETRIRINTQPYAEIDYTPLFGTNENVTFQAINQSDADNDPLYYKWESSGVVEQDFGETVTIRHNSPGIYAVTLTVDDSSKATNSSYSVRQEYEVNAAPQLAFSSPEKVAPGNEFILDASATTDQNDTTLMYNWFVDGDFIGGGKTVSYVLDEPGMVDVRLEV
ncbi:MAG: PKD domain-containing protein, partial [Gracilimonas sp.]|nr:PKD domain-containing protein [Gracilimonas sp.]